MAKITITDSQMRKKFSALKRAGDVTRLVNKFNGRYSQPHVSNVLAGRRNNNEILKSAYKLVSKRKAVAA